MPAQAQGRQRPDQPSQTKRFGSRAIVNLLLCSVILSLFLGQVVTALPSTHTVNPGESWWSIAQKYGINYHQLANWNESSASAHIYSGQVLRLSPPAATKHTVVAGESWWTISQQYGVTIADLTAANGKLPTQYIYVGQELVIPGKTTGTPTPTPPPAPVYHTVKSGESWWSISLLYGINSSELAAANQRTAAQYIYTGERLVIPNRSTPQPTPQPTATPAPTATPTPQPTPTPAPSVRYHTVKAGESYWSIGQQYGIHHNAIAAANGLSTSTHLRIGQVLIIPNAGNESGIQLIQYTVKPGDSWWSIATSYGITNQELAQANGKLPTQYIYSGQVLQVPVPAGTVNPTPPGQELPEGSYVTVAGDTWASLAARFGIPAADLARANGLTVSTVLTPGIVLTIQGQSSGGGSNPNLKVPSIPVRTPASVVSVSNDMRVVTSTSVSDPIMKHSGSNYKVTMMPNTYSFGNGLGMVIQTPNGRNIVVDGGYQRLAGDSDTILYGVGTGELQNLRSWLKLHTDNQVDAWIITHQHNDHARVPAAMIQSGEIAIGRLYGVDFPKDVFDRRSGETQSQFAYDAYDLMRDLGRYTEIEPGMTLNIDGVTLEFLNGYNEDLWRVNDSSAVMRFTFAGSNRSFLALADIQEAGAERLMERFPSKISADIVQVSHHGFDALTELYDSIQPDIALVPAGWNLYGNSTVRANVDAITSRHGTQQYWATNWQTVIFGR